MGVYDRNKDKPGRGPNYWIDYRVGGKRYQEPAGTSDHRAAEAVLRERKREIRDGVWRAPVERATPARPTVAEYAERWFKEREAADVRTVNVERQRYDTHVAPVLARKRMDEVRRPDIKALMMRVQAATTERDEPFAPRTVRHIYNVARAMFRSAVDDEVVTASPCTLRVRKGELPPVIDKDPNWRPGAVFTRDEVEALISDERIAMDRRVLYALIVFTGTRFGEAVGRRWRDYDREAKPLGKLTVATQHEGRSLKTGRPREIPVHPTLARILAAWRLQGFPAFTGHPARPDDWIVPGRLGTGLRPQQTAWTNLQEDLGRLTLRRRRLHDLRRSLISLARADGAREDLLRWVTHGPRSDIMDLYTTPPWGTLCEQIACLKVELRESKVLSMRAVVGASSNRFGDTSGDTSPFKARIVAKSTSSRVPRAGFEPARREAGDFKSPAYAIPPPRRGSYVYCRLLQASPKYSGICGPGISACIPIKRFLESTRTTLGTCARASSESISPKAAMITRSPGTLPCAAAPLMQITPEPAGPSSAYVTMRVPRVTFQM